MQPVIRNDDQSTSSLLPTLQGLVNNSSNSTQSTTTASPELTGILNDVQKKLDVDTYIRQKQILKNIPSLPGNEEEIYETPATYTSHEIDEDAGLGEHLFALLNDVQTIRDDHFDRATQTIEKAAQDVIALKHISDKFAEKAAHEETENVDISTDELLKNGTAFLRDAGLDVEAKNSYTKSEIAAMQQKILAKLADIQRDIQSETTLRDSKKKQWDEMEQFVINLLQKLSDLITRVIAGMSRSNSH